MVGVSATAQPVTARARLIVRRTPKRSMIAAANGPTAPYSNKLTPIAKEIVARDQPNSASNGTIRTPGAARTPAVSSATTKITAAMIQA